MKTSLIFASVLTAAVAVSGAASAQKTEEVGQNPYNGLHWSVAAPQGASWALECQFAPVTVRGIHFNRINHTGTGHMAGRLPSDNGSCRVTKTGGEGGVGVALVKNGVATAAGTNDPAKPAVINVF
ncbi:hypothetical protein ABE444_00655 [Brevundimonas pondensis]|jgi:hypothetical protein|uniref:Uncharacterized protein n=1 Tax=Brevundimonas pondensis TaxID=2774189 RepID=A0ABX7SH43_9CAUL|nr:hypothetical protein [Brevundimonas pondensis]QTC86944.1 hypothetical protein IFE19_12490 [Brevundimonas pondensis]